MNSLPENNEISSKTTQETIVALQQMLDAKSQVIDAQKKRIAVLEEYLRLARQKQFGRSSEKHPGQGEIFNEAELAACEADDDVEEEQVATTEPVEKPAKKTGRKPLSKNIPREQIHLRLSEEEKSGAAETFFVKVKEELDIQPAKVRVLEYMQEKAVFINDGQRTLTVAEQPKHPLGKSMASIGLLAFIVISKYMDGLPLYRLEKILQRYGGDITRASMANWIIRLSLQCQPFVHLMRAHQHAGPLIQIDETVIQVHKEPGYSSTGDKRMWVTRGGPPDQLSVLFEYDPSRAKEVFTRLIGDYEGPVQCDGYGAYSDSTGKLIFIGCWDHARRKFVEAQKAQPKGKKVKVSKADMAVNMIGKLYRIEKEVKDKSPEQIYKIRQQRSKPLLDELKTWLDNNKNKVPKDSLTGKAFTYLDNQWERLIRYCDDGSIPISNIAVENAIRPFVIGRKNWLFADTPKGAQASAVFYSLIETAKINNLDPNDYLMLLFKQLPYADTLEAVEALFPWNVKEQVAPLKKA